MFYVEVQRSVPYVESLWYDFDNLDEAIVFARESFNMFGVDDVIITDENEKGVEW